jgi:hypothetical protein
MGAWVVAGVDVLVDSTGVLVAVGVVVLVGDIEISVAVGIGVWVGVAIGAGVRVDVAVGGLDSPANSYILPSFSCESLSLSIPRSTR